MNTIRVSALILVALSMPVQAWADIEVFPVDPGQGESFSITVNGDTPESAIVVVDGEETELELEEGADALSFAAEAEGEITVRVGDHELSVIVGPAPVWDYTITGEPLVREEPFTISVTRNGEPAEGFPVTLSFYPGSEVTFSEDAGATDEVGELTISPSTAGLVTISAGGVSVTKSVRYPALPMAGVVVFLFALVLLMSFTLLGARAPSEASNPRVTAGT